MNADLKSNIAIVLSIVAVLISSLGGGIGSQNVATGPEANLKNIAKEIGVGSRSYDKCIADPAMEARVQEDIDETNTIVQFAQLQGIGTPFNLVITDTQAIPVSGAYPYEFFNLMVENYNESGTIPQTLLDQFEITPFDYEITNLIRGFELENDHYKGSETPEITVIEFSDFECPYCSRVHGTLEQLVDTHENVTWVYRHLPLNFHPQAMPAAIASECIAEKEGNGAFWLFADEIFADQSLLK